MVGAILFAGTVITVAANQVHLAVPLAITVALIIATVKGSFVAAVFHAPERREKVDLCARWR